MSRDEITQCVIIMLEGKERCNPSSPQHLDVPNRRLGATDENEKQPSGDRGHYAELARPVTPSFRKRAAMCCSSTPTTVRRAAPSLQISTMVWEDGWPRVGTLD